jgi:hypothetical protein
MPPDAYFFLTLALKMAITAGFVVVATTVAERAGPLVGGLVATLPLGAGPVYVFLALDHGPDFIAASAVNSLAINAVNAIFAFVYAVFAQRRSLLVSQSAAMLVWLGLAWVIDEVHGTYRSASRSISWCSPRALCCRGRCAMPRCRARRRAGPITSCARHWSPCWSALP